MAERGREATQDVGADSQVATTDGVGPSPVTLTATEERLAVRTEVDSGISRSSSTRTTALKITAGGSSTSGKTMPPTPPPESTRGWTKEQPDHEGEESGTNCVTSQGRVQLVLPQESEEQIVGPGMLKAVEKETMFVSEKHKFRLRVQKDSLASEAHTAGPITVSTMNEEISFESTTLRGMLQVECLPSGRHFDAPLLFDFPVGGDDTSSPVMDEHGCFLYEILMKENQHDQWVRDPESRATSLKVVKEGDQLYVRVSVYHFSWFSLWKKMEIAPQIFKQESAPLFGVHRPHQILVINDTEEVDIHVYIVEMSQLNASLESIKNSVGAESVEVDGEGVENVPATSTNVALAPELCTIGPGERHWLVIPRCRAGKLPRTQSTPVCIFTQTVDGVKGSPRMRMEGLVQLGRKKQLTVKLPVEHGRVLGTPAASEPGGVLSQILRVVNNMENASSYPASEASHQSHVGVRRPFRRSRATADPEFDSPPSSEHNSG